MSVSDESKAQDGPRPGLLQTPEHVLSTLEADGSRRWLRPRLAKGRFWRKRRVVAYLLLALYSGLPWIRIGGEPAILLDIPARRFRLFGGTFLPTDTLLMALTVLLIFLSIFFLTAVFGRVWCGWACPQTVYMEFVFRPIERLFSGKAGVGGKPSKDLSGWRKPAMYATYLVICLHLAQTFVAYFVGAEAVRLWMWGAPAHHPVAFGVVVFLTVLMMIDFAYWREQLCIIGCPYGRLQSVLLDRNSVIVSYDPTRGEPRGKLRKKESQESKGDCVACGLCVQVCPTGIDIRDGLQLECIHCTQCVDACDHVMDRVGLPKGLIRYSSQSAIDGESPKLVRPRVVIYFLLLIVLSAVLIGLLAAKPQADVTLLRAMGMPFNQTEDGRIRNTLRLKVRNRTEEPRLYTIELIEPRTAGVDPMRNELSVQPGLVELEPLVILADKLVYADGPLTGVVRVTDDTGWSTEKEVQLLGPRQANPSPASKP